MQKISIQKKIARDMYLYLLAEVKEGYGKKTSYNGLSLSLAQQLLPLQLDLLTVVHLQ